MATVEKIGSDGINWMSFARVFTLTGLLSLFFDDVIPAPKKPKLLPVVLSQQELVQFLDAVKPAKHRAILTACYAAGLRIYAILRPAAVNRLKSAALDVATGAPSARATAAIMQSMIIWRRRPDPLNRRAAVTA